MNRLQDSMDAFVSERYRSQQSDAYQAEQCMDALSDFLRYYTKLFPKHVEHEPAATDNDWEQSLDQAMDQLFQHDLSVVADLGNIETSKLNAHDLRDFLGWYSLRNQVIDNKAFKRLCSVLRQWLNMLEQHHWLGQQQAQSLQNIIQELEPECLRCIQATELLHLEVHSGLSTPPTMRGQKIQTSLEGHARIESISDAGLSLRFAEHLKNIQPVYLRPRLLRILRIGDVLDVELLQRQQQWQIIDLGLIYPYNARVGISLGDKNSEA